MLNAPIAAAPLRNSLRVFFIAANYTKNRRPPPLQPTKTNFSSDVTVSETMTAFFRPTRPEKTPVGIEITRNQTLSLIHI